MSISRAGPSEAGYRRRYLPRATLWRTGKSWKRSSKKAPSAGVTGRLGLETGAVSASPRSASNSGRVARTACTTGCATEGPQPAGKSNGWRPRATSRRWMGEGLEAPPVRTRSPLARGDDFLVFEFRAGVARRQLAQAVIQGLACNAVRLEFGSRVRRRQIAQTAVETFSDHAPELGRQVTGGQIAQAAVDLLACDACMLLEPFRRIAGRQIAQAAVDLLAEHLERTPVRIGGRVEAQRRSRKRHRSRRNQCQNHTCAHLPSPLPVGCSSGALEGGQIRFPSVRSLS